MKAELIKLLQEVPAETIVFKTMSTKYTAAQMIIELEQSTELGHLYGSDLMRVSRDFLKRQANKVEKKKGLRTNLRIPKGDGYVIL